MLEPTFTVYNEILGFLALLIFIPSLAAAIVSVVFVIAMGISITASVFTEEQQ